MSSSTSGNEMNLDSTVGTSRASATPDAPVGLSDPQYVAHKRRMLDAVNRLRATG